LQGTGAVTLGAAVSAMRICGTLLRNQRIVIFGNGVAGIGIAGLISTTSFSKWKTRELW
jgi:malate dehydrogenase (oxaloacetate-decarboxylating)